MASQAEIASLAIIRVGGKRITSMTENVKSARIVSGMWDMIVDEVLAAHPWNFAHSQEALAELTSAPTLRWDYAFQLPNDCLFVRSFPDANGDEYEYEIVGRHLHTNQDECTISYTARVTNPELFSAHFANALSFRLASEIAVPLVGSRGNKLEKSMMDKYQLAILEAESINDAQGNEPIAPTKTSWIEARS